MIGSCRIEEYGVLLPANVCVKKELVDHQLLARLQTNLSRLSACVRNSRNSPLALNSSFLFLSVLVIVGNLENSRLRCSELPDAAQSAAS